LYFTVASSTSDAEIGVVAGIASAYAAGLAAPPEIRAGAAMTRGYRAAMAIVPDDKDWTWVVQRPCPECGFESSTVARERVAPMLLENAASWQEVLSRGDGVRERPTDDRWSPLEYVCHVRDVFRLYDYRLGLILSVDDPTYPNWDQDETAIAERYGDQDPAIVAAELQAAADQIASRFAMVRDEQWSRTGNRSDGARFTIESFSRYLVHDVVHHIYDVNAQTR
jgi:hypothetical protein